MRVLLIGEYSGVHSNLAHGLRQLGHDVVVASDGDGWKNYSRDIEYAFDNSKWGRIKFLIDVYFGKFQKFDVVQIINYQMLVLSANKFFNNLLINKIINGNKRFFLGAFGDDYFWVKSCQELQFRYSPFSCIDNPEDCIDKIHTIELGKLNNTIIANKANGIIAGLYEYFHAYNIAGYKEKLDFIPYPIILKEHPYKPNIVRRGEKIKIFMGIQKHRSAWKGSDVLLRCLNKFVERHPNEIELNIAENIPYDQYVKLYSDCNIFVDQLYSYSPAMNALTAMAQGKILMGGGEMECYQLYNETANYPIINITPDENQIFLVLNSLLLQKDNFETMGKASCDFIEKHHSAEAVAARYVSFWEK